MVNGALDRLGGTTTGVASGKVILLGEHAVVYGVPALAVGIDRGAQAWSTPIAPADSTADGAAARSRLRVRGWEVVVHEDDVERDLARAFAQVLAATRAALGASGRAPLGAVAVEASSDLPPGGGLGCSAALGVAVARALDPGAASVEIAQRAMAWERVFHGNPSGIDAAVSAHGGCVHFEKGRGLEAVRVRGDLILCVGHSGLPSSTKSMVEAVAMLRAQRRRDVDAAFESIRALVSSARWALEAGDRTALGRLMDTNQSILESLRLTTPELAKLCSIARGAGAMGAKLTGAGGGGCVVALVPSSPVAAGVLAAWGREGFAGFATKVTGSLHAAPAALLGERGEVAS